MHRSSFCLSWLVCVAVFCSADLGRAATWEVGLAKRRITPRESIWMSGYASRDRPADGVRTELWTKAIALKDGSGRLGLVLSLDVVGFGPDIADPICAQLMAQHRLAREQIVLNASHTHTGPVVGSNLATMYFLSEEEQAKVDRYAKQLAAWVVAAANEAVVSMEPAQLSYAVGQATFGVNRRNNPEMLVPKLRFEGQLRGPVDYSVPVLRISDAEDRLQALLFGYACHATVLSDYQWSGDYPGYAQSFLESRYPGVMAQFVAGCGADVNPLPRRKATLAIDYGQQLADAVTLALRGVGRAVTPELQQAYQVVELPFDRLPDRKELERQVRDGDRYQVARARKWLDVLDRGERLPADYGYPVSWWRLGQELDFIALGGEVVVEFALFAQARFGARCWVAGYSHDVMGYIPSRRIWNEGGYEGGSSMIYYGQPTRWAGDVEKRVMEALGELAGRLDR